jgi:dUTP pyrophosphatase
MSETKLYVEKIDSNALLPIKHYTTDSGWDIYVNNFKKIYRNFGANAEQLIEKPELIKNLIYDNTITLAYLERTLIGTGIKVCVDPGYEIQVRSRSGLALKDGLVVTNQPGTIDSGFRAELGVIITNLSRSEKKIQIGDRIAQIVVVPICLSEMEVVSKLSETDRNEKGFGSTQEKK